MRRAFYYIAVVLLVGVCPACADEVAYPIVEPSTAAAEISRLLADAKPDEAIAALEKYLHPSTSTQFTFEQLTSAFKSITKNGKADIVDEIENVKYGKSIDSIVFYLHFPHQENPTNSFLFIKYTFMKTQNGSIMKYISVKTSDVYPPEGWSR